MNETMTLGVVTRIYTAAGRRAEEVDLEVWHEALSDLEDPEVASVATTMIVRHNPAGKLASPGDFRDAYHSVLRRREQELQPAALDVGKAGPEFVAAIIAKTRAKLRAS